MPIWPKGKVGYVDDLSIGLKSAYGGTMVL